MIASLRAFFLARAFREKALLAGWFVLVAAVWASSLSGRAAHFARRVHQTTSSLNEQQLWLNNRAAIEAQAQAAAGKLEAARTLDAPRLLAEILAIADETGLKSRTSGESKDSALGQFSVHTIQFSVTKVDWATLKEFYLALSKRSPYIGIEEYTMQVDRANPTLLTANFQLSSVEITKN
jgi:FAD/FMN-containing dehydrogenase